MSDTDLIVPVRVHALLVNQDVRAQDFLRWQPRFRMTLDPEYKLSAEPGPYEDGDLFDVPDSEGVHVQWQLPEALTAGHLDQATGEMVFPLVPNRWLVVRRARVGGERKVAGWLVQSDYLEKHDDLGVEAFTQYLDPFAPAGQPRRDYIGRAHPLADGPWEEPPARPLFLTAIGPGLPAFAAFAPYHENVFLFHDTLADLTPPNADHPPDATLSYQVVGWYSHDDADLLRRAADVPDLLPPDTDPEDVRAVAEALGWAVPDELPTTVRRTRYAGTALGVPWRKRGYQPPSSKPAPESVKVAIGHSTADAAAALAAHQTRSARTGDLVGALHHGDPDALDTADGEQDLAELTHASWFAARDGGQCWEVACRPQDDGSSPPSPEQPEWVAALNADQAAHDAIVPRLEAARWRLWSLWWLRNLPEKGHRPPDYDVDPVEWDARVAAARADVETELAAVTAARALVPHADDPDDLPAAIADFAARKGLGSEYELRRRPLGVFHRPADPVVLLSDCGPVDPLTRAADDPLPCRTPSALLTGVVIGDGWAEPDPDAALPPNAEGLPPVCAALAAEFELLERAATTAEGEGTALHAIVADPGGRSRGPWPEHLAVWSQPWLPMYLQWRIVHCATPYASADGEEHWEFDGERYRWLGTGAEPDPSGSEDPEQHGGLRWTDFTGRAFLTPSFAHTLRGQVERQLASAPSGRVAALRELHADLSELRVLSQRLDGFGEWLLQRDGRGQLTTESAVDDPELAELIGESDFVPDGAGDRRDQRFQPVRGGQFYFRELHVIDRFGQTLRKVAAQGNQPSQFAPIRAAGVRPDHPIFPDAPGPQRYLQLPPRLLHETRVRFEALSEGADPPVACWLLVNHLDRTVLVHAPDGGPLGELRVVQRASGAREIAWTPLPHAPVRDPADEDFRATHPHAAAFALGLRGRGPDAFDALVDTINAGLERITDAAPSEDTSPLRLLGRPVALVRAGLGLELRGPQLTDPAWDRVLDPPREPYPDWRWTARLGDADLLRDGLIGYYQAPEPGEPVDYDVLRAVIPEGTGGYVEPVGTGSGVRVRARLSDDQEPLELTLLMCPHSAVTATTDVLPVAALRLDTEVVGTALRRIRGAFRLTPLLAVERGEPALALEDDDQPGVVMPRPACWHGDWTWAEPVAVDAAPLPDWVELPIAASDDRARVDDPVPTARAGYLLLRPAAVTGEGKA
ncbi:MULTISPECIES: hypothetical protein [Actinosynnema]|uniref:hypothetical protein n=1 Tax=Actinosynnema TaxID=40566 RepID=UPI0020A5BD7A|nr:hypothetical protein [Actinosynnema pretiosum]MCP2098794.1 hypothetical protein [Actinosynnema pretiosum]